MEIVSFCLSCEIDLSPHQKPRFTYNFYYEFQNNKLNINDKTKTYIPTEKFNVNQCSRSWNGKLNGMSVKLQLSWNFTIVTIIKIILNAEQKYQLTD
jgi:hypothetical protein